MSTARAMSPEHQANADKFKPKLPPSVAAQVAKAEAMQKEAIGDPPAPPPIALDTMTPAPETPPVEASTTPPPVGEPPAPAPPIGDPPATPPAQNWEAMFKSEQGRVQAAVAREQTLQQRLDGMERTIAALKSQAPTPAPTADTALAQKFLTAEEEEQYGSEMLDVIGRKAREIAAAELGPIRAELKALKDGQAAVGTVVAKNGELSLKAHLAAVVPDWERQSWDEGFSNWLDQHDPYAGRQRREMLTEAYARQDAGRVINFFQGYRSTLPPAPQPTPGTPTVPALTMGADGKVPLASFAAPGKASSAAPASPAAKPVYSPDALTRFYVDQAHGRHKGREAEAAALEADIFAAQHEGRIQR